MISVMENSVLWFFLRSSHRRGLGWCWIALSWFHPCWLVMSLICCHDCIINLCLILDFSMLLSWLLLLLFWKKVRKWEGVGILVLKWWRFSWVRDCRGLVGGVRNYGFVMMRKREFWGAVGGCCYCTCCFLDEVWIRKWERWSIERELKEESRGSLGQGVLGH